MRESIAFPHISFTFLFTNDLGHVLFGFVLLVVIYIFLCLCHSGRLKRLLAFKHHVVVFKAIVIAIAFDAVVATTKQFGQARL